MSSADLGGQTLVLIGIAAAFLLVGVLGEEIQSWWKANTRKDDAK